MLCNPYFLTPTGLMFPRVIDLIDNDQRYRDAILIVCLVQSSDPKGKYRRHTSPDCEVTTTAKSRGLCNAGASFIVTLLGGVKRAITQLGQFCSPYKWYMVLLAAGNTVFLWFFFYKKAFLVTRSCSFSKKGTR